MMDCDRDCLHCPYPKMLPGCVSLPLTQWEREVLKEVHRDSYTGPRQEMQRDHRFRAEQACIGAARKARGLSQKELAVIIGRRKSTIASWEVGLDRANWELLCAAMPELEQYRPKEEHT